MDELDNKYIPTSLTSMRRTSTGNILLRLRKIFAINKSFDPILFSKVLWCESVLIPLSLMIVLLAPVIEIM